MDKLEIGIGNNLNLDNEVWDDEYNFSYNYGNDIGGWENNSMILGG